MRIAIDARELQDRPTGVGRYLAGLLGAWERHPAASGHEFVLCTPNPLGAHASSQRISRATRRGGHGTFWEQFTLPRLVREVNADVLFAPAYSGPALCPVPMVVAIHDVSFAAHPEWFSWREGIRRRALARLSARRATRIVTISRFSRGEIAARLGAPESKIDVIYPAASAPKTSRGVAAREHVVLYVGSLFTRRHIPELITGFATIARERADVQMDIVGENRTTPFVDIAQIAAGSGAGDRISVRSYVSDDTLASLYGRARAFVFLSRYEGFALTPLEALAEGIPIVLLDTPVAREVYEDAALYVREPDPAQIAAAIRLALFDEVERARVAKAGQRVLARYSWETCAEQVLQVLVASAR